MLLWLLFTVDVSIWTKQHYANTQTHLHGFNNARAHIKSYTEKNLLTKINRTYTYTQTHCRVRIRKQTQSLLFTEATIDIYIHINLCFGFCWLCCSEDDDDAVDSSTAAFIVLYVLMINWPLSWYSLVVSSIFLDIFFYFDRVILCHTKHQTPRL